MYFSKIRMRGNSMRTRNFYNVFRSPYTLHQAVWRLFAGGSEQQRDFLYRMDQSRQYPVIYAVSARPPLRDQDFWLVETKDYHPKLGTGMRLEFVLRVNPVVTKRDERDKRARHDVVMDLKTALRDNGEPVPANMTLAHRAGLEWLGRRAAGFGFEFEDSRVRVDAYQRHRFKKSNNNKAVSFSTLDFAGALTVSEPEAFARALYNGIGPAKGFGCGLLLVRKIY